VVNESTFQRNCFSVRKWKTLFVDFPSPCPHPEERVSLRPFIGFTWAYGSFLNSYVDSNEITTAGSDFSSEAACAQKITDILEIMKLLFRTFLHPISTAFENLRVVIEPGKLPPKCEK
jgi:hypothetical protein